MKALRISDAKMLADKLAARGVIVLTFGPVSFASASYGQTRTECQLLAGLLDRIVTKLAAGEWSPWAFPDRMEDPAGNPGGKEK